MEQEEKTKVVLKVASKTNSGKLAGSLVKNIQENKEVEIVAIGAGAVNQMVKALAISRGWVASTGLDLAFIVGFADLTIKDTDKDEETIKTAIKIRPIILK